MFYEVETPPPKNTYVSGNGTFYIPGDGNLNV